jgi:hypothetical protein
LKAIVILEQIGIDCGVSIWKCTITIEDKGTLYELHLKYHRGEHTQDNPALSKTRKESLDAFLASAQCLVNQQGQQTRAQKHMTQ